MTEPKVKELLECALAKIKDKEHWTTQAYARDMYGCQVSARNTDAVSWCASGALLSCFNVDSELPPGVATAVFQALGAEFDTGVSFANDAPVDHGGVGHKGIVEGFQRAIQKCEEREG